MDDLPGSGTLFFGPRWDAPRVDHATQVDTPVGEVCLHCEEPIEAGDRGLLTPALLPNVTDGGFGWVVRTIHLECDLRAVLSHTMRQCRCFAQHPTLRAEARATLAALNEQRREQGMGPL